MLGLRKRYSSSYDYYYYYYHCDYADIRNDAWGTGFDVISRADEEHARDVVSFLANRRRGCAQKGNRVILYIMITITELAESSF